MGGRLGQGPGPAHALLHASSRSWCRFPDVFPSLLYYLIFKLKALMPFLSTLRPIFSLPLISTPDVAELGGKHRQKGSPLRCEPTFPDSISARTWSINLESPTVGTRFHF